MGSLVSLVTGLRAAVCEMNEPNIRSNAETESLALAYTSVSLCVFEASSIQHGRSFCFGFCSWSVVLYLVIP